SLCSESSTEKLKTSGRSSNFSEPERSVEKERTVKNSYDSQLPELSQNSYSCSVNGKAAMGESGLCAKDPKSNFYNKSNFNLSSSKDHSPRKYPKDFSPLRMNSDILTDTQKNDLAGGDYVQSETEDKNRATIPGNSQLNKLSGIFSISHKDFNKQKAAPPTEEPVYSEVSLKNDNFLNKSFNVNNETLKDSDNIPLLELLHNMFIDKENEASSSKPFICQETNVKHSWLSNFPVVGDTHNDSNDFSGLKFKLASNKQEDTSPKEGFEFQKVPFKSCITPNKNTNSKSNCRSEINSDRDFISQNKKRKRILNSSQSSYHSSASFDLNHEFNTEKKEMSNDPLYAAHKTISSNNDFDLFKKTKHFSNQDSSDKISSVSSILSRDGESYQHSMKNVHSPTNNTTCKLRDYTGISLCPISDSHKDSKGTYILSKFQLKSDSSEGGGNLGFDKRTQEFTMQSAEGISLDTDTERESGTISNTYHSSEDSDTWELSVSDLVEYFENLNSETDMQKKKTKSEPLVQIDFACNGSEGINKNFLDSNKNKRKLHMDKGCLEDGNNTTSKLMDYTGVSLAPTCDTFNLRRRCFNDDCQSKSSDLLYHKEARKMEKCGPVDDHDKNKDDLMDCRKYGFHHIDKLKEPASKNAQHSVPKVDLLHFSKSESNIPLLQSQSLELETEHPKESIAPQTTDNNTDTDKEKLASGLRQMKGLFHESSRDCLTVDRFGLSLENTFSKDSSKKSAKSSGSVQKSSENQVSNSNQRSFFSRWRVMALIVVLIVLSIDWKNLLERLDKNQ
ncbi:hypothetical protein AVEN_47450-2, partial [Araneus ventricosus]